jgi:DNA adenine methylase Dam
MKASPFNYTGSKYPILPNLYEHFPDNVDTFWDLFVGGGSVFINSRYDNIVINDIITPLIQIYQSLYDEDFDTIIKNIENQFIPKDNPTIYGNKRDEFNISGDPYIFFNLVSSCTNNMMRFNKKGKFNQTYGKRSFNDNTKKRLEEYSKTIKQKNVKFLNKSFVDVIDDIIATKGENFVYIDPPYLISEAGYNAYWSKELEIQLYDKINKLHDNGIKFMLSNIVEHKGQKNPYLSLLSKEYKVIEIDNNFNKVSKKNIGETKEVIVINY